MNIQIRKYNTADHYEKLIGLIKSEGEEWEDYLHPKYELNLAHSITYVAYANDILCGYVRSLNDPGLYIWVIDLLVHKHYRGHSIGKKLLEIHNTKFPEQDLFVLSDVDEYYKKQGYKREGSVFKIE